MDFFLLHELGGVKAIHYALIIEQLGMAKVDLWKKKKIRIPDLLSQHLFAESVD